METTNLLTKIQDLITSKNFSGILVLIAVFLFTRFVLVGLVKTWAVKDKKNRQSWIKVAKRLPGIILAVGVLFVWGQELRDFALSLVAVAAALVIATKEVILCLMGGLLKASTKLFEIGDRISVAGFRGRVIEHTLLATTLAEIGPSNKSNQGTGRLLKVPNSLFLSNTVTVVPSSQSFVTHLISATMPLGYDYDELEEAFLKSAHEVMENYKEEFVKFSKNRPHIEANNNLIFEPRVSLEVNAKDAVEFGLRLIVPYEGMGRTENEIIKRFMKKVSHLEKVNSTHDSGRVTEI